MQLAVTKDLIPLHITLCYELAFFFNAIKGSYIVAYKLFVYLILKIYPLFHDAMINELRQQDHRNLQWINIQDKLTQR